MRVARGYLEGGAVDVARHSYIKDEELRRGQDMAMYRLRRKGRTAREAAAFCGYSRSYFYKRMAAMPQEAKDRAMKVAV